MSYLQRIEDIQTFSILPISQMQQADAIEQIWQSVISVGSVTDTLKVYETDTPEYKMQTAKVFLQVEMIRTQFSDLSPKEVQEAFQLAVGGNLPNVTFKDAKKDLAKVLHAYRDYKAYKKSLKAPDLQENTADIAAKNAEAIQTTFNYFKMLRRKYKKIGQDIYTKHNHNNNYWSIMYTLLSDAKMIRITKKVKCELETEALSIAYNRLINPLSYIDNTSRDAIKEMYKDGDIHTELQKEAKSVFRAIALKYLIEH